MKVIDTDGKLVEPEPEKFFTRDMVDRIFGGIQISDGSQDMLQDILYLTAVLPSLQKGLLSKGQLTLSGNGTAVETLANPHGRKTKSAGKTPDIHLKKRHNSDLDAQWSKTATKNTGILAAHFICFAVETLISKPTN